MINKEFQYYLDHQNELLPLYEGKYIAIAGEQVVGAFDSQRDAFRVCKSQYAPGTFQIQLCTPGDSAYTVKFYSPVSPFAERV